MKTRKYFIIFTELDKEIYRLLKVCKTKSQSEKFLKKNLLNPEIAGTFVVIHGTIKA